MAEELRSRTLSIPAGRNKAVWKAWERLAERLTPPMPTAYTMRPSHLFVLIGEKAIEDPDRVMALVRQIVEADQW